MKKIKIAGMFEASAVSLGCMRMGNLDEKSVDAIIDTAIENGIDFFDQRDGNHDADIFRQWRCDHHHRW